MPNLPIPLLAIYIVSLIFALMGLLALFGQKIYIDQETNEVTEFEVKGFGKLKTNYPALLFVVIGGFIAFYAYRANSTNLNTWNITGSFQIAPDSHRDPLTIDEISNLAAGQIFPNPTRMRRIPDIDDQGEFEFWYDIENGYSIEDVLDTITYQNKDFLGTLVLKTGNGCENSVCGGIADKTLQKSDYTRRYIMYLNPLKGSK